MVIRAALFALGLSLACVAAPAFAQENVDDAPPLADWLSKYKAKNSTKGAFPRKIAVVSGFAEKGEAPRFVNLDRDAFRQASYMEPADIESALWTLKIDPKRYAETDPKELVFLLTGADTVVVAAPKAEWEILRLKDGKVSSVAKAKGLKEATKPERVADWLPYALGWDGVVLERKGEFLLVGSTASLIATPEIQALAVTDSQGKFSLRGSERVGAGLVSLSTSSGGNGVFDIVFVGAGVRDIPAGTKLLIEKRVRATKPGAAPSAAPTVAAPATPPDELESRDPAAPSPAAPAPAATPPEAAPKVPASPPKP